jgi:hypothetical protein
MAFEIIYQFIREGWERDGGERLGIKNLGRRIVEYVPCNVL